MNTDDTQDTKLTAAELAFSASRSGSFDDDQFDTTVTRALSSAEKDSIERAQSAFRKGDLSQREVSPGSGVYVLVRK